MASVPSVPPGWSVGPSGEPISPDGQVYPPGTSFDAAGAPAAAGTGKLPVLSTAAGAVAGHLFGKSAGWTIAGGILGFWLKPLES
ncbi:MAG: hypothetical protein EPO08_21065 [Rhodospirillaceae bacterium]|nr:MAG: hypothetical protein EPO08_21065 [Rhodospirillaceae bacterium]